MPQLIFSMIITLLVYFKVCESNEPDNINNLGWEGTDSWEIGTWFMDSGLLCGWWAVVPHEILVAAMSPRMDFPFSIKTIKDFER